MDCRLARYTRRPPSPFLRGAAMTEVWLQPNRRVLALSLVPLAALAAVGVALLLTVDAAPIRAVAWVLVGLSAVMTPGLLGHMRRPRIAYRDGEVLFHLRAGEPVATPVEVVEAFFLGQGPAHVPVLGDRSHETVNLIARLSQKAPEWARVDVKRALGQWCDGYVTIRGTWCEPLDGEVIRRLNRRLREVKESC